MQINRTNLILVSNVISQYQVFVKERFIYKSDKHLKTPKQRNPLYNI